MELKRYLLALFKWWWLMLLATCLAAGISYKINSSAVPVYQATTTMRVGQFLQSTNPNVGDATVAERLAQAYAESVQSQSILEATVNALGIDQSWKDVATHVSAAAITGTELLKIGVVSPSSDQAKAIADEIAHQLILQSPTGQLDEEQQKRSQFVNSQITDLQNKIESANSQMQELQDKRDQEMSAKGLQDIQNQITVLQQKITGWQQTYASLLDSSKGSPINHLSVEIPAVAQRVGSSARYDALLAAVLGFLAAALGAVLVEYLDDTLATPDEVAEFVGLATLGSIPRLGRVKNSPEALVTLREPRSRFSEQYRLLMTRTKFEAGDDRPLTLLLTSPSSGEGKSLTAANLAVVFAQSGNRTILVDANIRHPSVHLFFGRSNDVGLTSHLDDMESRDQRFHAGGCPPMFEGLPDGEIGVYLGDTQVPGLSILTSGPASVNPSAVLGSPSMDALLKRLGGLADVIVVDSPPLLPVADALVLAGMGLGVLLVVRSKKTRREAATKAKEALVSARPKFFGVVLNCAHRGATGYYSHEHNYGGSSNPVPDHIQQPGPGPVQTGPERARRQLEQGSSNLLDRNTVN